MLYSYLSVPQKYLGQLITPSFFHSGTLHSSGFPGSLTTTPFLSFQLVSQSAVERRAKRTEHNSSKVTSYNPHVLNIIRVLMTQNSS